MDEKLRAALRPDPGRDWDLEWKNLVLLDHLLAVKAALDEALRDADWDGPTLRQRAEAISEGLGEFLTAMGQWRRKG